MNNYLKKIALLVILVTGISFTGCSQNTTTSKSTSYSVSGKITNADGNPVKNVILVAQGDQAEKITTKTDAEGKWSLNLSGKMTITPQKSDLTFDPSSLVSSSNNKAGAHNFTAKNITDIDISLAKNFKALSNHNPLMTQKFGADPFAMVYNNRVYVYMTADTIQKSADSTIQDNTFGNIHKINIISSKDLVNWTDHGSVNIGKKSEGIARWANNSWAPAAAHKKINGKDKFFLYFANSGGGIGVLSSNSPTGPFTDPIGKPLVSKSTKNCSGVVWLFDPAVIVNDDGEAYLYFGGGLPQGEAPMPKTSRVVKLGNDMISLADTPKTINAPYLFEDSGINEINGTYYYSYCTNWSSRTSGEHKPPRATIAYMTSDNPTGPWTYQHVILDNPGNYFKNVNVGTNHHSIIEFDKKWYIFYHSQMLQSDMDISGGYRSTNLDKVNIESDGNIDHISATRKGVDQIRSFNPYQQNEAETMAWNGGITTKKINKLSQNFGAVNMAVTGINTGSFIGISDVDFGHEGPLTFTANVASVSAGNAIKVVADDPNNGEVLGYLQISNNHSLNNFVDEKMDIKNIKGKHDLFFIFIGNKFRFNSWNFKK